MKVKQLIKELNGFDFEAEVILSSDAEGNDFKELFNVSGLDRGTFWNIKTKEFWEDGGRDENKDYLRAAIILYPS